MCQPVASSLLRCLLSSISTANQSILPPTWRSVQEWVFVFLQGRPGGSLWSYNRPLPPGTQSTGNLDFDLDIDTGRQAEPHQHVDRLGIGFQNIDQPVVGADFKMLV